MKRKDNIFESNMASKIEVSSFDLGHEKKFTCNMGELIPSCIMEALPGDKFDLSYVNMVRFQPLLAPVMHKMRVRTEYFFVPCRILFEDWEDFICGTGTIQWPWVRLEGEVPKGSVADYLGIPPGDYSEKELNVSALPIAAYMRIWNDFYRDQNQQAELSTEMIPGNNTIIFETNLLGEPLRRAWEHDYFTSALPTPQQGSEVELPLVNAGEIPVDVDLTIPQRFVTTANAGFVDGDMGSDAAGNVENLASNVAGWLHPNGSYSVNVQAEAATISDLREAFALQAFLERTIRGGARYFEQLKSHFDTNSPDARLQMPELIGMNLENVSIGEVLATAQSTSDGVAVGSLAGHGISVGGQRGLHYECLEHGFIIGMMSIIPDTSYQDGLHRMFFRQDRFDYPWPEFANLGERPILNKEVLCHDIPAGPHDHDGTWGYVPKDSEWRYIPSTVAGDFREDLSHWTLARQFDPNDFPTLSPEFIECRPRTDIFAVINEADDHIVVQVINSHRVVRCLPRHAIPSTLR